MKKAIVIVLAIVLLIGGTLVLFSRQAPVFGTATEPFSGSSPSDALARTIQAHGRIVPVQSASLSFPSKGIVPEGIVSEVLVKPGMQVEKGAVLGRVDTRDLQLRIEEAQAALTHAQATYEQIKAGAAPGDIGLAQAQVAEAKSRVQQAQTSVTPKDIAAAQATLESARANMATVQSGTKATRLQAAQANLDGARQRLQVDRDRLSADKTTAQLRMEQVANELRNLQDTYSRVKWENEAKGEGLDQASKDRELAAQRDVENAEKALREASVIFEQSKQAEINGIAAAEANVNNAQALMIELQSGSDADVIAAARARIAQAEADLSKLQGGQKTAPVTTAQAQQAVAEAALAKISSEPRAVDLAVAEAQVKEAEAALKREQLTLELAAIRAPFAGTVVDVGVKVGEVPALNVPAFIMADLSKWQIETDDLSEQEMVRLHEGDAVKITFDAISDFAMNGHITRIDVIGRNNELNRTILYTAVIAPDGTDPRLRWNMSATLEITPSA